LYPLEQNLLNIILDGAPLPLKDRLRRQVDAINLIQRLARAKEIDFYRLVRGRPSFDENMKLPLADEERKLCTVCFSLVECGRSFKVDAWVVNGFLFSLTFDASPKRFFKRHKVIAESVRFFDDRTIERVEFDSCHVQSVIMELQKYFGDCSISRVNQPLQGPQRDRCIAMLGTGLPEDYQRLMAIADGFVINNWTVHGLATVRHVVDVEQNYYILAEALESLLAVVDGDSQGQVYSIVPEEGSTNSGESFVAALRMKLSSQEPFPR
jgi:hypothetical protein